VVLPGGAFHVGTCGFAAIYQFRFPLRPNVDAHRVAEAGDRLIVGGPVAHPDDELLGPRAAGVAHYQVIELGPVRSVASLDDLRTGRRAILVGAQPADLADLAEEVVATPSAVQAVKPLVPSVHGCES
jgi:hypothetical protein